ncbi:MAG: LysM peptidoglycan-binding domain-containing protein, partial [Candidatus Rifleibacteriota bacterium]
MKGQKLAVVLMLLALQWVPAADASTQPFDENTVVLNPAAGGDDPFNIKTDIPAIVKEVEAVNEEIKKLFDDNKDTTEEKTESVKKIVKHTVKAGDSLWVIAQRLLGDGSRYREIIEANKDKYPSLEKNPDLILTGWELEIPQEGTAAAPETDNTNSVTDSGNDNETTPNPAVDNDNSSSSTQVTQIPQWSTKEKIAKLQSAVDTANRKLLSQGKRIAALNTQTVKFLIDNGFMTDEEWMAMNPPAGYTYRLDKLGKVELVGSDNKPLTNDQIAKIDSKAKAAEEPKKDDKKAEDAKKAEEAKKA